MAKKSRNEKRVPGEVEWPRFKSWTTSKTPTPIAGNFEGPQWWSSNESTASAAQGKQYPPRPRHTGVGWVPNRSYTRIPKWVFSLEANPPTNRYFYSRQGALPPIYVNARPKPTPNPRPPAETPTNRKPDRLEMIRRRAGLHAPTADVEE